jgi:hypothetical protein
MPALAPHDLMTPRYPQARALVHSTNPLVLIAAVRTALRQAGASREEIRAFTRQAFASAESGHDVIRHCQAWVEVEQSPLGGDPCGRGSEL